jgi:hypothetical protein
MLPFKLLVVNQPFPHDISELGFMPPVVVEKQIVSFNPNGAHSDSYK